MKETYTTFEISQICGVFMSTVAKWIDEGKLNAFRTPGGHRRTTHTDLTDFLKTYKIPFEPHLLHGQAETILLIANTQKLSQFLRHALKKWGMPYAVKEAANSFEAGKTIKDSKPKAIIADLDLLGPNGVEMFRSIRQDPETAEMPIIALMNNVTPEKKKETEELRINACHHIPDKPEKLAHLIFECLKSKNGKTRAAR